MLGLAAYPMFGNLMADLEAMGFARYILPFLLVFAFTYVLVAALPMFTGNKGAAAIIAFAIGFLTIQLNFVSYFFTIIFPRFGIGLSILLIAMILTGFFKSQLDDSEYGKWALPALAIAIFVIIAYSSLADYTGRFYLEGFWYQYGSLIVVGGIIVAAVWAITRPMRPVVPQAP